MGNRQQLLAAVLGGTALMAACLFIGLRPATAGNGSTAIRPAPEFTHTSEAEWLNSKPLTLASLKGQVVMVEFWTFECWNCYRSFPWLNAVYQRLQPQGLALIGVHTPEFAREKVRANIAAKLIEFDVKNPVMIDNDFSTWNAFGNRYWPAFYLIDKQGRVRAAFAGETHKGDAQAVAIEAKLAELLAEPGT